MTEKTIFNGLLIGWFILAVAIFVLLLFIAAPYGRHARRGWGYTVGNKLGWVLMEAPAPILFAAFFVLGREINVTAVIFFIVWETHYFHRAFIYPFSLRGREKRMPLMIVGFGFIFNLMNGYLNGRYIFTFSGGYATGWLADPRFILGIMLFIAGYVINRQADLTLRSLRQPGESGYRVAHHGLYRWISCPNYFGELVIWFGWALATWSLAGLAFAVWTAANLIPRAKSNHDWYKETFADYPEERKALVPGLW
jgi:3-oxo-5-alpha-steroid 4-dehydrogenase 1